MDQRKEINQNREDERARLLLDVLKDQHRYYMEAGQREQAKTGVAISGYLAIAALFYSTGVKSKLTDVLSTTYVSCFVPYVISFLVLYIAVAQDYVALNAGCAAAFEEKINCLINRKVLLWESLLGAKIGQNLWSLRFLVVLSFLLTIGTTGVAVHQNLSLYQNIVVPQVKNHHKYLLHLGVDLWYVQIIILAIVFVFMGWNTLLCKAKFQQAKRLTEEALAQTLDEVLVPQDAVLLKSLAIPFLDTIGLVRWRRKRGP